MLELRAFMFERVYLGPAPSRSGAGDVARSVASSTTSPTTRTSSRPTGPATCRSG